MPIDLRDDADDAVITFTDRVSELSGLVQDAGGQPVPEYHIVLFARDKAYWTPTSRRLRTVRPAADGKYVIANLPPGDYLMTAVTDMEQGEQFDPAFLEVLSALRDRGGDRRGREKNARPAAQSSAALIHHDGTRCVAMNQ